jgi:hypothetical protein
VLPLASVGDAYRSAVVDTGKQPEFLLLVSFLITFGFIRTSAHLIRAQVSWWPGNVEVKGRHIHHLVWGIMIILILGYTMIAVAPGTPWREALAIGFGIGMGLTLDEFALWLDLRDVYWLPEGRKSIDAVIVAGTAGAVLLLGVRAWIDLADGTEAAVKLVVTGSAAAGVVLAVVNVLRGRRLAAAVSLLVPLVGVALAVVLPARPTSIWARLSERVEHGRDRTAARADPGSAGTSADRSKI